MPVVRPLVILLTLFISSSALAVSDLARKAYGELQKEDFIAAKNTLTRQNIDNDPDALFLLGMMFDSGRGVEIDRDKAAELYLKAAQNGHHVAQLYTGIFYKEGISYKQDLDKAVHWLSLSAQSGNPDAQMTLGNLYSAGSLEDEDKSIYWLRKASAQGSTRAMGMLAAILAKQNKNLPEAYAWSNLAAKYDPIQFSTSTRFVIEQYSTPEQIEEGKKLMRQFENALNSLGSKN